MKDKSKYLWIYSLMLLGVAVILIIAGSLSLGRISMNKENNLEVLNTAAKESISSLSDENKSLQELVIQSNKEKVQLEENVKQLEEENMKLKVNMENIEKIIKADELYKNKKYSESAEIILTMENTEHLEQNFKIIYDELYAKLKKAGKIQE